MEYFTKVKMPPCIHYWRRIQGRIQYCNYRIPSNIRLSLWTSDPLHSIMIKDGSW